MGQNRAKRLVCKGKIELQTSLHTAGEQGIYTDAPFYIDYKGHPVLRGTSIAGALLDFLYDTCDNSKIENNISFWEKYFPGFSIKYKNKDENLPVSSIYISDGKAEASTVKMIKDSTSIDRKTKAAKKEHKFDLEIVPPYTKFSFLLEAHLPESKDNLLFEEVVFYLLEAFKEGLIFLGGKKSAGLGRVKLMESKTYLVDFSNKDYLKEFLLERDNRDIFLSDWDYLDDKYEYKIDKFKEIGKYLKTDISWYQFKLKSNSSDSYSDFNFSPLMIKSGYEGENADSEFMTIKSPRGKLYYFPGSSLRGVFRSYGEYILKTLSLSNKSIKPCEVLDRDKACSAQFKNQLPLDLIVKKLCPACLLFGSDKVLASSIYFEDIFLRNVQTKIFENVAINRFTGGANPSAKFNEEPAVRWEMDTNISLRFLHNKDCYALMALLFLILREAEEGSLLYGSDKYRGKGKIRWKLESLEKFSINISDGITSIFKWESINIDEEYKKKLDEKWQKFLKEEELCTN